MTTPNMRIREITTEDFRDEVIISDAINKVDQRLAAQHDIIIATDANVTLVFDDTTQSEACNYTIRVQDPSTILTATRQVIFPAGRSGPYVLENLTAQSINAEVSGGAAVTVLAGETADMVSDGTDMLELASSVAGGGGTAGSTHYDVAFFFQGKPYQGVEIMRIVWIRGVETPVGLTLSLGSSETVTTAATVYDIQKNGVSIGTANFALGANSATFSAASKISFAAGDTLSMVSPTPQDATQENIGFMLHLDRT